MRVNLTRGSFRLWILVTVLWVSRWNSLRVLRLARRQRSPHSQHSHEMQVEEPVQGPSHSGGVRALVSMELSASNERLDFTFP